MKQFTFIFGWMGILLIIGWSLYDSFEYFSKNLTDVIYIFAIAIVGGMAFWIYGKCAPEVQSRIRLIVWGVSAIAVSWVTLKLLFFVIRLSPDLLASNVMLYLGGIGAFMTGMTCYCWWEFYKMLQRRQ